MPVVRRRVLIGAGTGGGGILRLMSGGVGIGADRRRIVGAEGALGLPCPGIGDRRRASGMGNRRRADGLGDGLGAGLGAGAGIRRRGPLFLSILAGVLSLSSSFSSLLGKPYKRLVVLQLSVSSL